MIPAHQGFEGDDDVAGDVADRLVIDLELVALQRRAQVEFQNPPRLGARVHSGLEEAIGAAAVRLGAVEREIGLLQQFVGVLAVLGRQRDADADADDELVAADIVGRGNLLDHVAGEHGHGRRLAIAAELHDREFVAAEPCHRVVLGDAFAEPAGDFLQQRVADRMAERVVDVLEMIEIEAEHRELIAAPDEPQRLFELFAEQRPVRQIGQRVMARHMRDLLLGRLPFGDVLEGRDPSAALHGLIDDADRTSVAGHRPGHAVAGLGRGDHAGDELIGIAIPSSERFLLLEHIEQQAALKRHIGPSHHLGVALVEQQDAAIRIEHAKSLRHVVERGVEQDLLLMEFALRAAVDHGRQQR